MPHRYLKQAGDIIGRYRVDGPLGYGIEGEVYRVIDTKTGRVRSLKLLRGRHRLAQAQAAAEFYRQLGRCPAIKRFHHIGALPGQRSVGLRSYLIFDCVDDAVTLQRYLAREPRLPCDVLIKNVCEALAAIHRTGLAVGDFSRGRNILVDLKKTGRMIFVDLDYGEPGHPNRDQRTDLAELRRLAGRIYTDSRCPPNVQLLKMLDHATSAASACRLLDQLIDDRASSR